MNHIPSELTPEQLTFVCDPDQLHFETTDDLPNVHKIVGQDRAVRAIDFGVEIPSYGFNIYAMGPAGTGKMTTLHTFLDDRAHREPVPDDWCYVNNFADRKQPRAVQLPAGHGIRFQKDMAEFIRELQAAIATTFDSEDYQNRSQAILRELERNRNAVLENLIDKVKPYGFTVLQTSWGLALAPVVEGQVLGPEEYAQLPADVQNRFETQREELEHDLDDVVREVRALEKKAKERLQSLNRELAELVVGHYLDDLEEKYATFEEVLVYLEEVRKDVVENIEDFHQQSESEESDEADPVPPEAVGEATNPFARYLVNVVTDHSRAGGAPVIYATNPTYQRLVGRIEQVVRFGMLTTDFTHIRAGYLHHANGGYLVVNARDLLAHPFAWDALKRAIKNQEITTEMVDEAMPPTATSALEPEPIPFKAKVILVGDARTYYLLFDRDEDFRELFKIRADFGYTMDCSAEGMRSYADIIASTVRADGLLPFDRKAVARVIEFGTRLAEDKHKLTTSFGDVVEIIHEAAYWTRTKGHSIVTDAHVDQALEERRYRASYLEERLREQILEGSIQIQVEGKMVGQVNGLTIMSTADYEFGMPSRISAQTYMGRGGVVAIDREAHLTGNIYNKAILILQGYLGGKYARQKTLSLAASLTFEQNYDRIEGDSASSAELYALLSSLSGLPIRQDIAITGSVDQQGHVQAIGGVSAKVEGFFDLCQARGLTGTQGVLIPSANIRHLVLRPDVVESVRQGQFHVYAVDSIDQGIELLTGVPAGKAEQDSTYPEGSVNYLVQKKLLEMAEETTDEDEEDEGNPGEEADEPEPEEEDGEEQEEGDEEDEESEDY
jgi:lon-related putative ATP-dependent protease